MTTTIHLKRVYEKPELSDGLRILAERLWPRGLTKEQAAIDYWAKDAAPSTALRKWFSHEPAKWEEFKTRYYLELETNAAPVAALAAKVKGQKVTFVFASKEEVFNNAAALRAYLTEKMGA